MDWLTFIALKVNISLILHVLRFEGIISAIKVVYDLVLEVMVQINIACAMVSTLDLSSSFQQWGPHFPFFFATRPCTAAEVITFLFIKEHY